MLKGKMRPHPKSTMGVGICFLLGFVGLVPAAVAESHDHHDHKAHEHGAGKLNFAVDGNRVEIEVELPGVDVVGFEHAASTAEQKAAIKAAAVRLGDGLALFEFPKAAGCQQQSAEVEAPEAERDHDEKHAGEDKEHAGEDAGKEEESHSEFHAHYQMNCAKPAALKSMTVKIFTLFPSVKELDAQIISPSGQSAQEITPQNTQITF